MQDYHIHTKYCNHAVGDMEDYIKSAISKGIDEMGFSDHYPMFYCPSSLPFLNEYSMKLEEFPLYLSSINRMKNKYHNSIEIKTGVEVDYLKNKEKFLRNEINKYDFDYIIGSVHIIDGWVVDDEKNIHLFDNYDIMDLYVKYFSALKDLVKSKLFDVLAHFDVIKKFNIQPSKNYDFLIEGVLEIVKENDLCLEINTAGLDKPIKDTFPSSKIFKKLVELDIPIVFGSDAHKPEEVARYFKSTIKLLNMAGCSHIVTFTKRSRKLMEI